MRMPVHHDLKCWPIFFLSVVNGNKQFEVRENDRDFRVGDTFTLHEYIPENDRYTSRTFGPWTISYVLGDYPALRPNYVVFCWREDDVDHKVQS